MEFDIIHATHFDRDFDALARKHVATPALLENIKATLLSDPYNITRQRKIKKLSDVKSGEGEWRLRIDKYRIRYDLEDNVVKLYSIRHRKEGY